VTTRALKAVAHSIAFARSICQASLGNLIHSLVDLGFVGRVRLCKQHLNRNDLSVLGKPSPWRTTRVAASVALATRYHYSLPGARSPDQGDLVQVSKPTQRVIKKLHVEVRWTVTCVSSSTPNASSAAESPNCRGIPARLGTVRIVIGAQPAADARDRARVDAAPTTGSPDFAQPCDPGLAVHG
jgi:hypothetical protein